MHGYTTDSDSEDEYRQGTRGAAPASTNPADAAKKKKKPKMPPQQRINYTWKHFSNRKFNKALSVLPFDPVRPSAVSDRANELLSAGYERAAEECRRKVKKIIQECRRVNMRYRDPGWDLVSRCFSFVGREVVLVVCLRRYPHHHEVPFCISVIERNDAPAPFKLLFSCHFI